MNWSISGIPDVVVKDQQTNQECRYNSGSQVRSWELCYAAIAGTNEATSEVLQCDLNIEKNSTIVSVCRCISEKYDFWRVNMSSCKCSDILLVAGEHMLGLEECCKCPASFTHKHSLQSSYLHNCKHKELPLKPNSEKLYPRWKGQSGWN